MAPIAKVYVGGSARARLLVGREGRRRAIGGGGDGSGWLADFGDVLASAARRCPRAVDHRARAKASSGARVPLHTRTHSHCQDQCQEGCTGSSSTYFMSDNELSALVPFSPKCNLK